MISELFISYNYPKDFFEKRVDFFSLQGDDKTIGFSFLTEGSDPFLSGIVTANLDSGIDKIRGLCEASTCLRAFILSDGS